MFAIKPIVLLCVFDVNDDSINKKKEQKKRKERSFVVYIYFYLVKGALGQLREL